MRLFENDKIILLSFSEPIYDEKCFVVARCDGLFGTSSLGISFDVVKRSLQLALSPGRAETV
jgi:hypothetical protein